MARRLDGATPRQPRTRLITALVAALLAVPTSLAGTATAASVATTGPITGYGGKCVDVAAANPANNTPVQLYTCNGSGAQQWTVADDGTIRALGKCLDIAAGSTANGARAQIYDCNGTGAQQWSSTAGQLVNPTSGKCLDATGPSSADGTPLQIWSCTGAANQTWTLPTGGGTPPPPSGGFTHPGVLVSRGQLDFVRGRVQAGAQPWASAYNQMMGSRYASLSRTPAPRAVVECGSYSNPNNGCTDEREDAIAAYTDALAWYVTGDARYAQKSIQIMDAWSATITAHTGSNAPLQTGWAASVWPRAAEVIKYTYTSWPNANRFATMLRNVYLPMVRNGSGSNGNWELTMMEATVGIAVFLEDRAVYDAAVARFLNRTRAFVYLPSDGALPYTMPGSGLDTSAEIIGYWHGQSTFVAGLAQETCRDFVHTGYGISAISHVAETSRVQGRDLYPQVGERLRQALGLHSRYQLGEAPPSWLCGGSLTRGLGPITEVGFNAMSNRLGNVMTNTQTLTLQQRPAGSNNLFVAWETLTHANNPN
ncbi:ricin-type beta-trefoil lectin domain protein [Micromonospora cremea]|uniref:Alginate lyase n=1 Tax=Micromonospora cremea TaxID=709881 RepID=A0A1N5W2U8_9ACTN|nr:ricin-type beta-trefoil lectin domain protein [Micromonospora cremea]SIM79648.1 Alginate lyase [Micromonospora cremea]